MITKAMINAWRVLVSQNNGEAVISKINKKNIDTSLKDELLVLSSKFQRLKQLVNKGGLGFDEIYKEKNKINISIFALIRKLEVHYTEKIKDEIEAPKYCEYISMMLYEDEIEANVAEMNGWKIKPTKIADGKDPKGSELVKTYQFNSFLETIEFMSIAAEYMEEIDHHPYWENVWRTLIIRLSTWNIGHKVSALDFEMACYLESLFENQFKNKIKTESTKI